MGDDDSNLEAPSFLNATISDKNLSCKEHVPWGPGPHSNAVHSVKKSLAEKHFSKKHRNEWRRCSVQTNHWQQLDNKSGNGCMIN